MPFSKARAVGGTCCHTVEQTSVHQLAHAKSEQSEEVGKIL